MADPLALSVTLNRAHLVRLTRTLSTVKQPKLASVTKSFLLRAGYLVLSNVAFVQIIRQGRVRVRGPRGGKGRLVDADVHPTRLTNRHGGAGLLGSLSQNKGTDRSGLPHYIRLGSDKVYAPVHELGLRGYPKRPFLQPALAAIEPQFEELLLNEVREAVNHEWHS